MDIKLFKKVRIMKVYRVKGTFRMGREWQKFTKDILDESEEGAREKILSIMGSKHRVLRTNINLDDINEVDLEKVDDPVITGIMESEDE